MNYDGARKAADLENTAAAASTRDVIAKLQKAQRAAELTMEESGIQHQVCQCVFIDQCYMAGLSSIAPLRKLS